MHFERIHTLSCCIFLETLWSPSANFLSYFLFGNKLGLSVLPTCMCYRALHWNVGGLPVATSWKRMEPAAASSSSALVWALVSFFLIHAGTLTGSVLCSGHSCYQSMCGSVMSRPADISERPAHPQVLRVFTFSSSTVFPVGPWGRIAPEG